MISSEDLKTPISAAHSSRVTKILPAVEILDSEGKEATVEELGD